jgi:hypothetical protein
LFDETGPVTSLNVESKLFDDVRGDNAAYRWQVRYEGENLGWTPWSDPTTFVTSQYAGFTTLITSNTANFDLEDELEGTWGWNFEQQVQGTIEIAANVFVYSTTQFFAALRIPNLPFGSQVSITNSGRIVGKGGDGGEIISPNVTKPGDDGGPAFEVLSPVTVNNFGNISGGGGGGAAAVLSGRNAVAYLSGGGGAGIGIADKGLAPSGVDGGDSSLIAPGFGGSESGEFIIDPVGDGAAPGGEIAPSDDPDTTSPTYEDEVPGEGDTYLAEGSVEAGAGGSYGEPGQQAVIEYDAREPSFGDLNTLNDDVGQPGQPGAAIIGEGNITWLGGQANVQGPVIN